MASRTTKTTTPKAEQPEAVDTVEAGDTTPPSEPGTTEEKLRRKQFPAVSGAPELEVDERSADGSDGTRHVKEFVVLADTWPGRELDESHKANAAAVANEAIQRGLHPRGEARFDGTKEHPDGVSLSLFYSVDTVPSSIDHRPFDTTTPRDVLTNTADG